MNSLHVVKNSLQVVNLFHLGPSLISTQTISVSARLTTLQRKGGCSLVKVFVVCSDARLNEIVISRRNRMMALSEETA